MNTETIRYERDADGIVTLTLDDPQHSVNTMRAQFSADLAALVERLSTDGDDTTGIILASAKSTFLVGGDLRELYAAKREDAVGIRDLAERTKGAMRSLETLGKPVVALINGSALGGGLELALSCHRRIAQQNAKTRIGFPEVTLGLLPGGGGITRTVRMLGVVDALWELLLEGRLIGLREAGRLGVVDEIVAGREEMLAAARAWIRAHPRVAQPWDSPEYRIPGGAPSDPELAQVLPSLPAKVKSLNRGAHYDAPHHILAAAVEGAAMTVDRAFQIETRYFVDLVCNSQQAKNMTRAFFFDARAIRQGTSRPPGHDVWRATKVAVLGAGMMGAGIAYAFARSGVEVVLKDVSTEKAEAGKDYSRQLVAKAVQRGRVSEHDGDALLGRIAVAGDYEQMRGCDLVVEAVFESPDLKRRVLAAAEEVVKPGALLASNTSTLPITDLAIAVQRGEDFVGLHFFSPVDKMQLVEIVKGRRTSDAALARAVDVVVQIGKTPIVVNDSRGFFTSRVIAAFLNEALAALGEGINPVMIERAGLAAGYPAPPLQLMDELTLTLPRKVMAENKAAAEAAGQPYTPHPAEAVLDRMIGLGRPGRAGGAGFYEYEDGRRTRLWDGLIRSFDSSESRHIPPGDERLFHDLQERMLFSEAIETVRCFDERVITSHADANIGSIIGIGFPRWTGGVAQFIDQYAGGVKGFVGRCDDLAARYGHRFEAPASLVERARRGQPYRDS